MGLTYALLCVAVVLSLLAAAAAFVITYENFFGLRLDGAGRKR
jgi:hypothetical protein